MVTTSAASAEQTTAPSWRQVISEDDRLRHPGLLRIPVIYVTVPPAATPRMLAVEFARFLGLPMTTRANITDVIEAVCGVAVDARVSLVCVDEIHNLQLATRNGAEVSDTLKYFSERIPATFVYAGIDVERQGLFTGTRGRQIAGRFALIETVPFPYADRLAHANHLRPSYLRRYLPGPPSWAGAIRPERLAALAGRPLSTLQRALPDLDPPSRPQPTGPRRRHRRQADKPALFAAIRR